MDSLICRICLDKSGTISVFEHEPDNVQYSVKLKRLVNIMVSEDDGLPSMMCEGCANELSLCYQFVQKCEASDKALRCLSAPIELYSDLPADLEIDVKIESITNETDDCDNLGDHFLFETCSKDISKEIDCSSNTQLTNNVEKNIQNIDDETNSSKKQFDNTDLKGCNIINDGKFRRKKVKTGKLGPVQCDICGHMTCSPSAMEIHIRTHTGEKPFICNSCGSKYPTKGSLKRHIETYHSTRERRFTCETCGSSFFRKNDIITHIRVHTDERPYGCPYCSKKFRQVASRNRHQKVHTGEKPYSCPICNKKFSQKSLVQKHQSVHSDEKKYTCHMCNKSVKSQTALRVHIKLHTNDKQNICSFCGVAFAMKGNLQTHIRRIHSEKSGQCSVCLKTFSNLEAHMRKHTGEKPYICGICNTSYAVKRSLANHMLVKHENVGKFKCSIPDCPKTFPTAPMREFHILKHHTNHTPYLCQHCPRQFFRTSDLSRHLRASHMDFKSSTKSSRRKPISYT